MCFSLAWLEQLCVYAVVIWAIYLIIKMLIPYIQIPILVQILQIVLWAIIAILVIYVIFGLLSCLLSMGGGGLSLLPPHR